MVKKNIEKIIEDARAIGVLDEIKARNIEIRRRFKELRDQDTKYDDATIMLSEEYFLSLSAIKNIVIGITQKTK